MTEDEIRRLGALLDEKMSGVDRRFDELHRHFDVVAENLQGHIQQVAEGVLLGNERLDRVEVRLDGIDGRLDHFETAVRADFSEVKSMVKLSFAELDRRLTTLESIVHDLTGRLERLETRTS